MEQIVRIGAVGDGAGSERLIGEPETFAVGVAFPILASSQQDGHREIDQGDDRARVAPR
ncbi:MAG TPA: hypothetical protein VJ301_18260 [Propionibacteriaceae bacterium]|nr:hypothetical protein [Propionibacteriaceae bacterium]